MVKYISKGLHHSWRHQLHRSQLPPRARGVVLLRDGPVAAIDGVPRAGFFAVFVLVHVLQTERALSHAKRLKKRFRPRWAHVLPRAAAQIYLPQGLACVHAFD